MVFASPVEKLFGDFPLDSSILKKIDSLYESFKRETEEKDTIDIWYRFLQRLGEDEEIRKLYLQKVKLDLVKKQIEEIKDGFDVKDKDIKKYLIKTRISLDSIPPETIGIEWRRRRKYLIKIGCFPLSIYYECWDELRPKGWSIGVSLLNRTERTIQIWITIYRAITEERNDGDSFFILKKVKQKKYTISPKEYTFFYFPTNENYWIVFWQTSRIRNVETVLLTGWDGNSFSKSQYVEIDNPVILSYYLPLRREEPWYFILFKPPFIKTKIYAYRLGRLVLKIKKRHNNPLFIFPFFSLICFLIGYLIIKLKTFKKGGKDV